MIRAFDGKQPRIADSAFVSERAYVVGDVEIGERSGVWPGAVIRGDFASIRIGKECQIEDNCVVHSGTPVEIGDNVIVGHSAVVHCARIGHNVLVGNNATLLDCAEIGDNCIIGANSLVATGQKIPPNSLVIGVPGTVRNKVAPGEIHDSLRKRIQQYSPGRDGQRLEITYTEMARRYKEQGL